VASAGALAGPPPEVLSEAAPSREDALHLPVVSAAALPTSSGPRDEEPVEPAAEPTAVGPVAFKSEMVRPSLLSGHEPVYTREALVAHVEGTMVVKCTITTEGVVERCRVLKGLPHMNASVVDALESRRYTPVMWEGKPTAVDYIFNVQLVLPR
jgi:TonB family protein